MQALLLAINVPTTLALMFAQATSWRHPDSTKHLRWLIEDLNLYAANKSEKHMSGYGDAATASLAKRAGLPPADQFCTQDNHTVTVTAQVVRGLARTWKDKPFIINGVASDRQATALELLDFLRRPVYYT